MRLIDADALKQEFNLHFGGISHAVAAAKLIDAAPTIPRIVHGKWEDDEEDPLTWRCSNCGYHVFRYNNTPYCHNCGAIMDEQGVSKCS